MVDAEHWQRAHDSAQDALSAMSGKLFLSCYCTLELCLNCYVLCSECLSCFSDRRQAAKKKVEKAERTISNLKAVLASKEQELHDQHEELVHLRQAEDALAKAESVECKRLRVLAGSLVCKLPLLYSSLCFFVSP